MGEATLREGTAGEGDKDSTGGELCPGDRQTHVPKSEFNREPRNLNSLHEIPLFVCLVVEGAHNKNSNTLLVKPNALSLACGQPWPKAGSEDEERNDTFQNGYMYTGQRGSDRRAIPICHGWAPRPPGA